MILSQKKTAAPVISDRGAVYLILIFLSAKALSSQCDIQSHHQHESNGKRDDPYIRVLAC